jgi:hypothetical protein
MGVWSGVVCGSKGDQIRRSAASRADSQIGHRAYKVVILVLHGYCTLYSLAPGFRQNDATGHASCCIFTCCQQVTGQMVC